MRRANILEAIGNTPLVEIPRMSPKDSVHIFAKLEGNNPTGSVKDRIAKYMVEKAEEEGLLTPDKTILEPTSGNTGIALAMIGRRKGYRVKVVMPENVSQERIQLLHAYGAEIELSDGRRGTNGSVLVAQEMAAKDDSYFMPYQYGNANNPLAHYETTGAEIIRDLPDVDAMWMLSVMGACWSGSPPSEDSPSGDGAVAERKTKPATATKKKSTKPKPVKAKSAAKK